MTGSATAAARRALGAYGESLAARHLVEVQGMVLLDRNWRCDAGEIDLVLRDGPVLVVCEVKTRSSVACGTPHEAVDDAKLGRLQAAGGALDGRPRGPGPRRARRPGGRAAAAPGAGGGRARPGDRLMPFATAHTVSLHGALGHLIDVQADVSPGQVGHHAGRPPRRLPERGPGPLPHGHREQQPGVAGHPADHDPAVPGGPAEAGHALRPGDRRRGDRRRGEAATARARGAPRSSGSSRSTAACARCRECCRWCSPRRSAASGASSCPSRRRSRRRWRPAWPCSACGRWPRWWPSSAARRCPRRRRSRRCRGAGSCRGAGRSGWRRSTWPTWSAWPTRGTPSRWPPPAGTT